MLGRTIILTDTEREIERGREKTMSFVVHRERGNMKSIGGNVSSIVTHRHTGHTAYVSQGNFILKKRSWNILHLWVMDHLYRRILLRLRFSF